MKLQKPTPMPFGKYKGRKPSAQIHSDEIYRLEALGLTRNDIANRLGISERSVYRVLSERKTNITNKQEAN